MQAGPYQQITTPTFQTAIQFCKRGLGLTGGLINSLKRNRSIPMIGIFVASKVTRLPNLMVTDGLTRGVTTIEADMDQMNDPHSAFGWMGLERNYISSDFPRLLWYVRNVKNDTMMVKSVQTTAIVIITGVVTQVC
jgi:hypothetical protein